MTEPADPTQPTAATQPADPTKQARPRPQYGEYATPQEVAIARGIPLDRGGEHVERLAAPITPGASSTKHGSTSKAPVRHDPPPRGGPLAMRRPGRTSPMLTVLLLVFGIWNTVTSIPSFLSLGPTLSQGLAAAGYGTVTFGATAHVVGIVLLVFSFLVLIAAVGLSLQRIRLGRTSFWVPLTAGGVWVVGAIVGMVVIVANTPGITTVMQNHS